MTGPLDAVAVLDRDRSEFRRLSVERVGRRSGLVELCGCRFHRIV